MQKRKRGSISPWVLVAAGIVGLVLIVFALRVPREPSPAASTATTEQPATSENSTPSLAAATPSSGDPTGSASLASPTKAPSNTPAPSTTPTKTPTKTPTPEPSPTPTPTPILLSPPLVGAADTVAYVEGSRLVVAQPAKADVRLVDENAVYEPGTMRWSPDGRRLVYTAEGPGSGTGSVNTSQSVQIWDGTTGEITRLRDVSGYPSDGWAIQNAVWSPGGTRLLLTATGDGQGAWLFDSVESVIRSVSGVDQGSAAWIDDDRLLVRRVDEDALGVAFAADPGAPLTGTLPVAGTPALSPARDRVAFLSAASNGGRKLTAAGLSDFEPLDLPAQPVIDPAGGPPLWSPNDRWIAYGAGSIPPDQTEGAYTLIADTAGGAETRIFPGVLPEAWSPDGQALAAYGCSAGSCQLSLIDASSGEVTNLASSAELKLWDLAWSPGGVYLTYSSTGSDPAAAGLVLWNRATGEEHRLLEATDAAPTTNIQWAGDGCLLYAARREAGAGSSAGVSEIWTVGPAWDELWQLAPAITDGAPSLTGKLENRLGDREDGLCPGPLLEARQVVAFYGTPLGPGLGILGRHGLSETLNLLEDQVQAYREIESALGPDAEVRPGFHMVTTIADDYAGPDGDFNHRVPHAVIRPWIEAVRAQGGVSILDVQPGLADLALEFDLIEPLLREPDVHLAVDPEFIILPGEVPGQDLGRITGPQVNYVQSRMDEVARETGQRKVVVIHQFDDRMIEQKEQILDYPLVDLVWDADGFGGPGSKIADYNQYKRETGFEYGGFKIFYRYDEPVMTVDQVLGLEPVPRLVIYQ